MQAYRFGLAVSILTLSAYAQQSLPELNALPRNFYHDYVLVPIGSGEKYLLTLQAGGQKVDVVVEPVAPKDGASVTQYVLYNNGGIVLYSKTTITLPDPNGGEGTPVEGLAVSNVPTGPSNAPAATRPLQHQISSEWTSLPRKDKNFMMPMRIDRPGFGVGRVRIWLKWNGTDEIQVEPVDGTWKGALLSLKDFSKGFKYLSNVHTEGAYPPRFFYLRQNKDDSMTIFGNDDMETLKAIEKSHDK